VSNFGHVISRTGKLTFGNVTTKNYFRYLLQDNRKVHRLVWLGFYGKIPKLMTIDHINCCRYDNRLINLRLLSMEENTDAYWNLSKEHQKVMVLINLYLQRRLRQRLDAKSTQKKNYSENTRMTLIQNIEVIKEGFIMNMKSNEDRDWIGEEAEELKNTKNVKQSKTTNETSVQKSNMNIEIVETNFDEQGDEDKEEDNMENEEDEDQMDIGDEETKDDDESEENEDIGDDGGMEEDDNPFEEDERPYVIDFFYKGRDENISKEERELIDQEEENISFSQEDKKEIRNEK
jgi:hypothetical protein